MADISKVARLVNGVSRNIDMSTNTLVVDNLKIKLGGANFVTFSGSLSGTRTISMPDANVNLAHIANLNTLSGVSAGATDNGTFTGTTIPDSSTTKAALQALETTLESTAGNSEFSDDVFRVKDNGDATKKMAFEVGSITTATTRTVTMPDANVDLGLIATAIQSSEKASANGVATLDGGGKIPSSQLPSTVMEYHGMWDGSSNTPTLANGIGSAGDVYETSVAGTVNFGAGAITFSVGDWVVYSGSIWEKSVNSNEVTSVNTYTGTVVLDSDDIAEGSTNLYFNGKDTDDLPEGSTNLWFTEPRVRATVLTGLSLASSADVTATDSLLSAIGKLQAQLDSLITDTVIKPMVAGESMAANSSFLVRMALNGETATRAYKADIAAGAEGAENHHYYVIGMVTTTAAVSAGDAVNVVLMGEKAIGSSDTPFGATDIGKPVFLGASGTLTLSASSTANDAVVRIGTVISTTSVMVQSIQLIGIN